MCSLNKFLDDREKSNIFMVGWSVHSNLKQRFLRALCPMKKFCLAPISYASKKNKYSPKIVVDHFISSRACSGPNWYNCLWVVHDNKRISSYSKYYTRESAVTVSITQESQLLQ